MNKFVPFLIAVAIHALAFFWLLYRKNQSAQTELSARSDSGLQGIDLSGFSTNRKPRAQKLHSPSGPATIQTSSLGARPEAPGTGSDAAINSENGSEFTGLTNSIVLEAIDPVYPALARQKGIEGQVKLRAFYNHNGIIIKVDVIDSSGAKLLDEAAKKALILWKLKSGAEGSFEKTFQFMLNN
jgi:protein TonB